MKDTVLFLKFFMDSIKDIHVLTETMYEQMQVAREQIIDKYDIDCYAIIEELTITVAKVSGKLDFLDDAFTNFANEYSEGGR